MPPAPARVTRAESSFWNGWRFERASGSARHQFLGLVVPRLLNGDPNPATSGPGEVLGFTLGATEPAPRPSESGPRRRAPRSSVRQRRFHVHLNVGEEKSWPPHL